MKSAFFFFKKMPFSSSNLGNKNKWASNQHFQNRKFEAYIQNSEEHARLNNIYWFFHKKKCITWNYHYSNMKNRNRNRGSHVH